MSEVHVKENESLDSALKRFKRRDIIKIQMAEIPLR